jgi:uncharacterized membrane protein
MFGNYILVYLASLAAFLAIDLTWLGVVARDFYRARLGYLLSPNPNWAAAIIFYMLFVGGLLYFAVLPGVAAGSLRQALVAGALFGFFTYATYDLTNLATVKDWPWALSVVDMAWGTVLATAVAFVGFTVGRALV